MKKKNKIALIVTSVILLIAICCGSVWAWAANNPEVSFSIGKPSAEADIYIEHITVGYSRKLSIPTSKKILDTHKELFETMSDVRNQFAATCEAPTHLEIEISENENGGTTVRYHGKITKDGITSDYDNSWNFNMKYADNIM